MPLLRPSAAARAARRGLPGPLLAALVALVALTAACGGDDELVLRPGSPVAISPATITAVSGDTVRIRLTDTRGRALRLTVLGSSTTAATIDATGLVTAVAPGTTVVTISALLDGQTVTGSVPVTVLGFTLSPSRASLAVGGAVTLHPVFVGDLATYGTLRWTSSDGAVASVDADGTVHGVGAGVARIAVVAGRDPRLRAEAEVTTFGACCGWESLSVQPSSVTLAPGGTRQLAVTISLAPGAPAGTSRDALYTSSDTTIATVSAAGLITARRVGTAVITVAMAASPTVWQQVAVTVREGAPDVTALRRLP